MSLKHEIASEFAYESGWLLDTARRGGDGLGSLSSIGC